MSHRVASCALKICLTVFCGFVIAFGQSSQNDAAAKEAIGRAQAAYLKKDFALAKRELESALAIKKDLAEPHLLLGMVAWREGKIDAAIKSVREAIKYQPNYPEAHYVMGRLYIEKRDWKHAEEEANLALTQDAKFTNVYALLGDVALAREQYEAVKFFERALALRPPNGEVTNETRIKMEAIKNYVEFQAYKGNKDFQAPKVAVMGQIPRPIPFRQSAVKLAGIVDEHGRFTPVLVLSASDQEMAESYLKHATRIQFTPAKKNGAPVPIWQSAEYRSSESVQMIR